MSIKFLVLGGGILGLGGGSADFIFMGAGIFLSETLITEFTLDRGAQQEEEEKITGTKDKIQAGPIQP